MTVMFSAWPSSGIDSGYSPSSRAPFQYIGVRGPGTLEMTRLNGGRDLAVSRSSG